METVERGTDTERQLDDVMCSSDFKNTCNYSSLQEDVADLFTSLQEFTDLPDFTKHISGEAFMEKTRDTSKQLDSRKNDLMKTDCTIVVAGETSAGKSSVINLIIGEDILPSDITATTSRICRLKYSEKFQISTCDSEDKEIGITEFDCKENMAENLSGLARTKNERIKYIDVWLPIEILKGNVVMVDTPGIGDQDQKEVAGMMMDYLPNALAFVFVVNVASAGGLQKDRIVPILERVRGSLNQMHSFDPKDAIFLLNKWDSLRRNKRKAELFDEMKQSLKNMWKDVEEDYIIRFAATEVKEDEEYKSEFDQFQQILKSIIAKNENKRIKVHIEFIRSFIEDCDVVVAGKINIARQNTEENVKTFDKVSKELQDTERKRQEAFDNLQQTVDRFLDETTRALHKHIHSLEFKQRILQDIEKYTRFQIGSEIESRIKKETYIWQETKVEETFKKEVMEKIAEKFINIQESLHRITDMMKGFTSPFDVEKKLAAALVSFFAPSGTAIAGGILMAQFSVNRNAAIAVAATGLVSGLLFSGLVALDVLDDVDTTIQNAYKARIESWTTDNIKQSLTKTYAKGLKGIIQSFLEGDLKDEIDNIKRTAASMRENVAYYQREESNLISLRSTILRIRNRLQELENIEVKMD